MNSSRLTTLIENIQKQLKYSNNTFNLKNHEKNVEEIIINNGFTQNTNEQLHYINQPCGSQNPPDFRIFDGKDYIDIECKSKKSGYKPMWNSSIPQKHTFYIYTNKTDNKTLVIKGEKIISDDLNNILNEYKKETKKLECKYNKILNKLSEHKNPYNLNVYARNMFVQKKHFKIN